MAAWWVILVGGVALYTAMALGVTRSYKDQVVPPNHWAWLRRGNAARRLPWWAWAAFILGVACVGIASGALGQHYGRTDWVYLGPSLVASWVMQALIIRLHNQRLGEVSESRPAAS